jgi:hypothetical protein
MDRGWLLETQYPSQMALFGRSLQSCLEKYLSVREFISVAKNSYGLPRRQVVDVLRRWHQHMLPSRGVRLWDLIDNDDKGMGRSGTYSLYTNEEAMYLFKDKDAAVAEIFEEAKLSATMDLVDSPNFGTDIVEADRQFDRLVDIARNWAPSGGIQ